MGAACRTVSVLDQHDQHDPRTVRAGCGVAYAIPEPIPVIYEGAATVRSDTALAQRDSFTHFAQCYSVLLTEIGSFLAGSPTVDVPYGGSCQDFVRLFCLSADSVRVEALFAMNVFWEQAYRMRWPACYQAVCFHCKQQDWRCVYQETLSGRCEFTLEVFDREKKAGFAMAAMPAQIQFNAIMKGFIARYISASPVRPELIPISEAYRIRFCPVSAREDLQPYGVFCSGSTAIDESRDCREVWVPHSSRPVKTLQRFFKKQISTSEYPFRVMHGAKGLKIGRGVELQWKMQEHSPFGWWYGTLEAVHKENYEYGERYVATISFRHFPRNSPWYQVHVRFGDGMTHPCTMGGTTGGIRPVSRQEDEHWKNFFPKQLVIC